MSSIGIIICSFPTIFRVKMFSPKKVIFHNKCALLLILLHTITLQNCSNQIIITQFSVQLNTNWRVTLHNQKGHQQNQKHINFKCGKFWVDFKFQLSIQVPFSFVIQIFKFCTNLFKQRISEQCTLWIILFIVLCECFNLMRPEILCQLFYQLFCTG